MNAGMTVAAICAAGLGFFVLLKIANGAIYHRPMNGFAVLTALVAAAGFIAFCFGLLA